MSDVFVGRSFVKGLCVAVGMDVCIWLVAVSKVAISDVGDFDVDLCKFSVVNMLGGMSVSTMQLGIIYCLMLGDILDVQPCIILWKRFMQSDLSVIC